MNHFYTDKYKNTLNLNIIRNNMSYIRLTSWNVNGFRAIITKPHWEWFYQTSADIVALQETKADPLQISQEHREPEGWKSSFWLSSSIKKGYSGVAVFSKIAPISINKELPNSAFQGEGRLLHLEYEEFHFLNVYFPNGTQGEHRLHYKLGYYEAFLNYAQKLRETKPIVVCGDFNTAHKPIDLARPKANEECSGFLPIERAWMDSFISLGYIDTFRYVHGDISAQYSWWSYQQKARERNVGWRIDYFFVSEELKSAICDAWIEMNIQGSDHCPVGLALEI